jgi:PAS domain S-box-containing protein
MIGGSPTLRRLGSPLGAFAVLAIAGLAQTLLPALPPFVILYPAVTICTFLGGTFVGAFCLIAAVGFTLARWIHAAGGEAPGPWEIAALIAFAAGGSLSIAIVGAYQRTALRFRQERQRLKAALTAANAAVWEIDPEGRLSWDENFYRLVGLDPRTTPPTTEAFLAMVDAEDRQRMADARRAIDAGQTPSTIDEYRLHRPDGRTVWLENHRTRAGEAGLYYIGITQDVTRRKQAEERITVLLTEAAHRAKNQLAVIQAIARETSRNSNAGDAFYEAFVERIRALSKTHDLLVRGQWQGTDLRELLLAHWNAFGVEERCSAEGPAITIVPAAAQQLGMAFHELTTNAIKHGTLRGGGTVAVRWTVQAGPDGDRLDLVWRERGLPAAPRLGSNGFGMRVLQELVPYALLGETRFEAGDDGLTWTLRAPLASLSGPDAVPA